MVLIKLNMESDKTEMSRHCSPQNFDSVYLKVAIIEPILLACMNESSFSEIHLTCKRVVPMPDLVLREYIYYLIDNSFISYNGSKKTYCIEPSGLDLLSHIYIHPICNKRST